MIEPAFPWDDLGLILTIVIPLFIGMTLGNWLYKRKHEPKPLLKSDLEPLNKAVEELRRSTESTLAMLRNRNR